MVGTNEGHRIQCGLLFLKIHTRQPKFCAECTYVRVHMYVVYMLVCTCACACVYICVCVCTYIRYM